MAGQSAPLRSSSPSRLVLLLTLIPLTLAIFAFVLQWRGSPDDPASTWPVDGQGFPGMVNRPSRSSVPSISSSSSDCLEILGRSSSPSFSHYRGWNLDFDSDPKPKVRISRILNLGTSLKFPNLLSFAFSCSRGHWVGVFIKHADLVYAQGLITDDIGSPLLEFFWDLPTSSLATSWLA